MNEPKTTRRKLTDYRPDPENANTGNERGQQMIEDSVRQFGVGRSILADRNDVILAGNKTLQAAIDAGIIEVIEVETDGDAVIVHKRRNLDLTDERNHDARLLAYYDNRTQQVSLSWAAAQVYADHQAGVDLSRLFTADEMREIIRHHVEQEADDVPPARIGEIEEIHAKWQAQPGDLWLIPSQSGVDVTHRLFCGDSTDAQDVQAALGGLMPFICVTDPPYGVKYDAKWRQEHDKKTRRSVLPVTNDDTVDWSPAFRLFPGDVIYTWHAGANTGEIAAMLFNIGFQIRAQIIWRKQEPVISRGHYHWQHEPCFYAVRKGKLANWHGDRKQSTVWDIANAEGLYGR